jgi:hypothetical protein
LLLRGEHFSAGFADLVALLVQAGDDPATAGRNALAEFAVVALARGALLRRQILAWAVAANATMNAATVKLSFFMGPPPAGGSTLACGSLHVEVATFNESAIPAQSCNRPRIG